ncbi:MAG TPA: EamA family transporter, partial [Myxococcota bacterium]|nr:EamA family transporter [Myxococcota bacterium]
MLAPLTWACAVVLFRKASDLAPETMNFFKNAVAVVLLGITMLVMDVSLPLDRSPRDWAMVAASGFLGLAFADTLLFAALSRIGAARLAVVDTVYAPTVVL